MGEQLEIQWLADKPYLVQSNDSTKWQSVATELTPEQYRLIDELETTQSLEMHKLLLTLR